jgi:hypothetical protein
MKTVITTAMASALALSAAAPVVAQDYYPYRPADAYQQQQRDYDAQRYQYDAQRSQYEAQRYAYQNRTADYRAARADYERRLAEWQAARADYDARYGYGAYARRYGPEPVWNEGRWAYAPAPYADAYGRNSAYVVPTRCSSNAAVTAGIVGAIAGGVLGSNIAGHGDRGTGTVVGAVLGGGLGAAVGHAHDTQKCDERGAFYAYSDTVPYRVSNDVYRDDRYVYYRRMGCRLAPAPVSDTDYRYVRVCPDSSGRYRITG